MPKQPYRPTAYDGKICAECMVRKPLDRFTRSGNGYLMVCQECQSNKRKSKP